MSEFSDKSAFVEQPDLYNKKTVSVPKPEQNIGIDTNNDIFDNIYLANKVGSSSTVDLTSIQTLESVARSRDLVYSTFDAMGQDCIIASILKAYAKYTTEPNEVGKVVWAESSDPEILKYITFLLDTMNVDKYAYSWAFNLVKYGDIYIRLYRESDMKDDLFSFKEEDNKKSLNESITEDNKEQLNEDINFKVYAKNDHYTHYVEMESNPANIFELMKLGKTYAYIKTNIPVSNAIQDQVTQQFQYLNNYKFSSNDIEIYQATEFVHGCLEDTSGRTKETVSIFRGETESETNTLSYTVRRGQSILYNVYKIWRQIQLLEASILLNRVTKSSTVRVIQADVGDMPKENVKNHMLALKQMFEQHAAIDAGTKMTEYTNPGPIENTIYVPKRGDVGTLSTMDLSSNADPGKLEDLDYFKNKFYGSFGIPKQYFCLRGDTEILLLNGQKRSIKYLYDHREEYVGKGIMGCASNGDLDPTIISNIQLTKPQASFIRIHLDNGKYVDVTPEHRMMLRDGNFIEASQLNVGDSLMPYYDDIRKGRRYVLNNKTGKWKPQYRIVAESICDIPTGYQVHHKNSIKIDDDFDNLQPMTLEEHYREHVDILHECNKEAYAKKRELGLDYGNKGKIAINNGSKMHWIDSTGEIPEGYSKGMLPFTEEHKRKISVGLKGIQHSYNNFVTYKDKCKENCMKTKAERKALGLYDEQYRKHSEFCKKTNSWKAAFEGHMKNIPDNRIKKNRYVRCVCCKNIKEIKCDDNWYNEYINMERFWYCSKDCYQISGGGKLARSYNLLKSVEFDEQQYNYIRNNNECRPDTYFKYETLANRLHYISNYSPLCNHKVVKIEYLDVVEPAYDITVLSENHTFALPCGIFVHNCDTDDAAGFSGGDSLAQISAPFAKDVKGVQNVLRQMITDMCNIMLISKGQNSYINKFEIKMQAPMTKEESDRREASNNQIRLVQDTMGLVSDIEDNVIKLKMLKSLLSNSINNNELIDLLQEQIDKLESGEAEQGEMNFEGSGGASGSESSSIDNMDLGSAIEDNMDTEAEEIPSTEETGTEENTGSEELTGEETILPNPSSLNMDFSTNA